MRYDLSRIIYLDNRYVINILYRYRYQIFKQCIHTTRFGLFKQQLNEIWEICTLGKCVNRRLTSKKNINFGVRKTFLSWFGKKNCIFYLDSYKNDKDYFYLR